MYAVVVGASNESSIKTVDTLPGIVVTRFDHQWLTPGYVAVSQSMAEDEAANRHHFVPEFHLRRWSVDGKIKPVDVDSGWAKRLMPPKSVAFERDLYTLPGYDETAGLPLKWVETHLSRIENTCAQHLAKLIERGPGLVADDEIKRDLCVYLGLQISRTWGSRQRTLTIVNAPDSAKRKLYRRMFPTLPPEAIERSMRDQHADPTHEAIRVMLADIKNGSAATLLARHWAIYSTAGALVTCDEPVVSIAGPPCPRGASVGTGFSAAIVFPLDPNSGLVMLHPSLEHLGPFTLDTPETDSLNFEIIAAAARTAFERPTDDIIERSGVPARIPYVAPDYADLSDEDAIKLMLGAATPRTRWAQSSEPPDWPVSRWYSRPLDAS